MMFILHFMPDNFIIWIVHLAIFIGITGNFVGLIVKFVPIINNYQHIIKNISLVLLITGVFFEGFFFSDKQWKDKIFELEQKVIVAEQKSAVVNTIIKTEVVKQVKVIKEQVAETYELIKTNEKSINSECKIPEVALKIYNDSIIHHHE